MQLLAIQSKIYRQTKTNSSSYDSTSLNADITNAIEHIVGVINMSDMRWQWDDSNQTDLPIATCTLNPNFPTLQQDYSLTTAHLSIDRIEVKDSLGNWTLLRPIDQHDVRRTALAQYYPTAGVPVEYDKVGTSIFLYPTPNYSQAASLKIYFTRGPVTLVNPTDVPGFNSLFHDLICDWVSYEYWADNEPANAQGFLNKITIKEQAIKDFYGQRSRDERPRMSLSTNNTQGNRSGQLNSGASDSNR